MDYRTEIQKYKSQLERICRLWFVLLTTAGLLHSCILDQLEGKTELSAESRGLMSIEVVAGGAVADDYVRSARFIVFDKASSFPSLDVNKRITLDVEDWEATIFKTTLEVNPDPDKMLVLILNEPAANSEFLDKITSPAELEGIEFLMTDAFNENHTAPLATGIPMTGIKRGIAVTRANNSEESAAKVEIFVERTVARIELWMKTDPDTPARLSSAAMIVLTKTHDAGYLMKPDAVHNFGHMPTVTPMEVVGWDEFFEPPLTLNEKAQLVSVFYTPERTCSAPNDSDKPILYVMNVESQEGYKDAETILSRFVAESGAVETITEIRRNNIYRITGRVTGKPFEHVILPWTKSEQEVIIDPQYYLKVSDDRFLLTKTDEWASIHAETNYGKTGGERGFPPGIRLGAIRYYDKNGVEINNPASDLYDWLFTTFDNAEGELERTLYFTATNPINTNEKGYYATIEIKAGNLSKLIRVDR